MLHLCGPLKCWKLRDCKILDEIEQVENASSVNCLLDQTLRGLQIIFDSDFVSSINAKPARFLPYSAYLRLTGLPSTSDH